MLQWLSCGENVVLEVKNIKFKKEDGTLYITITRVVWTHVSNPSSPVVYYEYAQVKAQRISPDSAPKVRLQLVLHDDTTITFHFNNPVAELQKAERERVKELLVQLLQKHRKPVGKEEPSKKQMNRELEIKQKILQGSDEMFIMYKTLVSGGIISAEDFWAIPKAEELLASEMDAQQPSGISSAFMSEARPEVDGCNSIQYNLTHDIIQSIFHTYPMIKRKHQETVPSKMTEKDFWTRFFQSQYFHQDKNTATSNSKNDMFLNLAQEDEETSLQKLLMTERDSLLDTTDSVRAVNSDGYGMFELKDANPGSQPIVRKYNHHSFMICANFSPAELENPKSADLVKREQLKVLTKQDDLVNPEVKQTAPLHLSQSNAKGLPTRDLEVSIDHAQHALSKTRDLIRGFTLDKMHECILPSSAYDAMIDMSTSCSSGSSSSKIPKPGSAVMEELRICYLNATQILAHFWMCFPVTNATLEEKVTRMAESIQKYQKTVLPETISKLPPKDVRFLKHLSDQLDLSLVTYEQWRAKKGRR